MLKRIKTSIFTLSFITTTVSSNTYSKNRMNIRNVEEVVEKEAVSSTKLRDTR